MSESPVEPIRRKMALQTVSRRGAWILLGLFGCLLLVFFLSLFLGLPGVPVKPGE